MPSHSLRLQLLGIALILAGGLASAQTAAAGYGYSALYRDAVVVGLLAVLVGFVGPLLTGGERDATGDETDA